MKKIRLSLLIVALTASLILLSSCAVIDIALDALGIEPQNADQLYERIGRATSDTSSYTASGTATIRLYASGVKVSGSGKSEQVYVRSSLNDLYYMAESKIDMMLPTGSRRYSTLDGYCDGYAYSYNDGVVGEWTEIGIYSKMTAGEYIEYLNGGSRLSLGSNWVTDCEEKEFVHNEDGSWSLHLSDYEDEPIRALEEDMGLDGDVYDHRIEDVDITIVSDENFICQSITFTVVFDDYDSELGDEPCYTTSVVFGGFGETVADKSKFDKEKYNEVVDIRLLDYIEDAMEYIEDSDKYTFERKSESKINVLSSSNTYSQTDLVTFGENDDGYFFKMMTTTDRTRETAVYEDGILTVSDGTLEEEELEEYAAKATIREILFCGFNRYAVTGIKKNGDRKYEVSMIVPSSDADDAFITGSGVAIKDAIVTIIFTFNNSNGITSLYANYSARCIVQSGNSRYEGTLSSEVNTRFGLVEPVWENLLDTGD